VGPPVIENEIQVLLQKNGLIAVNKPFGISVHNNEDPSNLLILLEKQLGIAKLYPIHRLDKETSGIQLFGENDVVARELSMQFQQKTVKKIYTGVLQGVLAAKAGAWRAPLTDKSEGRKNPAGLSAARVHCETKFTVLSASGYFTLCDFDLITGRQHQIRKHTALVKHCLVGDPRYGDPKYNKRIASIYKTERMFLHCRELHIAGEKIEAAVPKEFSALFAN
jgi:tRNA pseudouridine65 synthase